MIIQDNIVYLGHNKMCVLAVNWGGFRQGKVFGYTTSLLERENCQLYCTKNPPLDFIVVDLF